MIFLGYLLPPFVIFRFHQPFVPRFVVRTVGDEKRPQVHRSGSRGPFSSARRSFSPFSVSLFGALGVGGAALARVLFLEPFPGCLVICDANNFDRPKKVAGRNTKNDAHHSRPKAVLSVRKDAGAGARSPERD